MKTTPAFASAVSTSIPFLLLLLSRLACSASGLAVQTGPEGGGDSVAGGIMYDRSRHSLYITGATNGNFFGNGDPSSTNCFLGIINLNDNAASSSNPFSTILQLGKPDVAESCSSLMHMDHHDKLFIAGASLEGGILSELRARGSLKATVYGMLMQVHLGPEPDNKFTLQGGNLIHKAHVQYPIAMDHDMDDGVYVASIISEDLTESEDYQPFVPQTYGYGSQFSVLVQRYKITTDSPPTSTDAAASIQQTMTPTWQREIGTSTGVYVAGLLHMRDGASNSLVLAGTSVGQDTAFPDITPGSDFDGIVTELDPATGELTANSYRVESQPERHDRIYGVCKQQPHDDSNYFYLVGTTTGNLISNDSREPAVEQAFIMKMEVVSGGGGFSMEWVRQIGSQDGVVQGLACAVSPDGQYIYMVGRVGADAALEGLEYESAGGTDVFLVQLEHEEGETNYLRQFGSSGDDYVNGVVTDDRGNAMVYGTTSGSFYRDNVEDEQDVFLLSFSREDGTYEAPDILFGLSPSAPTGQVFIAEPTAAPGTSSPTTAAGAGPPTTAGTPPTAPPPTGAATTPPANGPADNVGATENQSGDGGEGSDDKGTKVAISVIVLSIFALLGFLVYRRSRYYGKDLHYSDEDHVVEYLKGFDDVEVDLKHSATGGWHGTYLNPRYQSSDTYSYNSETAETAVRFDGNSSYVRDSLFMDDYDEPSFGSHVHDETDEREGLTRQRSNYDGLLDAYNTTWDDLSPHVMPTSTRASPGGSQRGGLTESKRHVLETIDFMKEEDDAWGKEII